MNINFSNTPHFINIHSKINRKFRESTLFICESVNKYLTRNPITGVIKMIESIVSIRCDTSRSRQRESKEGEGRRKKYFSNRCMFRKGRMASLAHAIARASFCYRGEHLSLTTVAIFEARWINTNRRGCVRLSLSILWFRGDARPSSVSRLRNAKRVYLSAPRQRSVTMVLTITMEKRAWRIKCIVLVVHDATGGRHRRSSNYDNHFITNHCSQCFPLLERISLIAWNRAGILRMSIRSFPLRFEGNF